MTEASRRGIIAALPAFNEEQHVGSLVLKARKYAAEVIVLDDGSADGTAEIARLAGATVIRHAANRGKGAAVRTILSEIRDRVPRALVLLDADGQHNPDEIPLLASAVLDQGYDLVVGTRRGQRSKTPFYRRIGQNVLSFSTSLASRGSRVKDSESGFRALSPRAMREIELTENGFAIETEMIVKAAEKGWKITEVPISTIYTRDGSTQNPVRHGMGVLARAINMISEQASAALLRRDRDRSLRAWRGRRCPRPQRHCRASGDPAGHGGTLRHADHHRVLQRPDRNPSECPRPKSPAGPLALGLLPAAASSGGVPGPSSRSARLRVNDGRCAPLIHSSSSFQASVEGQPPPRPTSTPPAASPGPAAAIPARGGSARRSAGAPQRAGVPRRSPLCPGRRPASRLTVSCSLGLHGATPPSRPRSRFNAWFMRDFTVPRGMPTAWAISS